MATTRRLRALKRQAQQGGSSQVGLRRLADSAGFRRLLAVRLTSQFADGLFQAGLAWLVLLSPERQQTPAAVAIAAVVILLPFSLVGPFTGVFLDRWSRRQVLVQGEAVRVGLTLLLVWAASAAEPGVAEYGVAVGCLGVNRFLLAALSAGLPHVVARELLVTANAVAPTAGTIATLLGVGLGGLVLSVEGAGSRTVLGMAAVGFGVAGMLALRLRREQLGPHPKQPVATARLRTVGREMAEGLRHLRSRPAAATVLVAFGSYRFWYGLWTVQAAMLMLGEETRGDLGAAAVVAAASGAGFLCAAALTPFARTRVGEAQWLTGLLVVAAVALGCTATTPGVAALSASGFVLGLVAQSLKICTDTALQRHVEDTHRGRAFAVYDVVFNLTFVAAAALAVFVVPPSGRTSLAPLLGGTALAVTALAYRLSARGPTSPPPQASRRRGPAADTR